MIRQDEHFTEKKTFLQLRVEFSVKAQVQSRLWFTDCEDFHKFPPTFQTHARWIGHSKLSLDVKMCVLSHMIDPHPTQGVFLTCIQSSMEMLRIHHN